MDNRSKLIKIYDFVCEAYQNELQFVVERFSNNRRPAFTDQEVMTIMLYTTAVEGRSTIRQVYDFTTNWMRGWFPLLPSYPAFVMRVNRLGEAFRVLLARVIEQYAPAEALRNTLLVDSLPIITCSAKRTAKVATEIVNKGYCATKSIYYHGVKLHMRARRVVEGLPVPDGIVITPASENDLSVFRDNWSGEAGRTFFADKAYRDSDMQREMGIQGSEVLTPVKYNSGVHDVVKQRNRAADDLFSKAVSAIRQPIEALFAWLIEKADIQRAAKVRSLKGFYVHVFNKLTATWMAKLVLNT